MCRLTALLAVPLFGLSFSAAAHAQTLAPDAAAKLRQELLAMRDKDQALRKMDTINYEEMVKMDAAHTARLKEIVAAHGWPTISMVGQDGSHAAWLLVQHADRDRDFQRQVLALMEPLVKRGEVVGRNWAYLHDRTTTPQRFGTQGRCTGPGVWEPLEIEDPENVDARRAEMGIMPPKMADYKARFVTLCK